MPGRVKKAIGGFFGLFRPSRIAGGINKARLGVTNFNAKRFEKRVTRQENRLATAQKKAESARVFKNRKAKKVTRLQGKLAKAQYKFKTADAKREYLETRIPAKKKAEEAAHGGE